MEEMMTNPVEDIFESTKRAIKEILQAGVLENIKKYIYKEHEFNFEHEDVLEMLQNLQEINLGLKDEVTVIDNEGNEITMTGTEYAKRNLAGFTNKAKEEMDLGVLEDIVDAIETFAEFVNFENLETAKEYYIPEPEIEVEEEEEEVVEEEVPEDLMDEEITGIVE